MTRRYERVGAMRRTLSRLPKAELVLALHDEHNINGADLGSVDLAGVNLARCNLSGARFGGADLSGSYLHGAIARHSSFLRAKMRGVAMPAAALEGAGFRSADLHAANMSWGAQRAASFTPADMSDAQLYSATMTGAVLNDAVLERARIDSVDLDAATLHSARMAGAILHGTTLRNADMAGADLRGADLRGAEMTGANLFGSQLGGAVYDSDTVFPLRFVTNGVGMHYLGPQANLARINLRGFEFRGQDLTQADLSRANLVGADLRGAILSGADLTGARLRRALYDHETVFPVDFEPALSGAYAVVSGAVIAAAKMQWKHLSEVALSGASLQGADLTGADLTGAQLNSADLSRAILQTANLTGASLHGADLQGAMLKGAILQGADMRRADARGADLSWANLAEADLRGANLSGVELDETLLRGARYDDGTVFPRTFDPATARMLGGEGGGSGGRARVTSLPEPSPVTAPAWAKARLAVGRKAASRAAWRAVERAAQTAAAALILRVATSPLTWFSLSASVTLAAAVWSGDLRWSPAPGEAPIAVDTHVVGAPPAAPKLTFVAGAPAIQLHSGPVGQPGAETFVAAAPTREHAPLAAVAQAKASPARRRAVVPPPSRGPLAAVTILGAAPIQMPSLASYGRPTSPRADAAAIVLDSAPSPAPVAMARPVQDSAPTEIAIRTSPEAEAVASAALSEVGADVQPDASPELVAAPAVGSDHDSAITEAVEAWRNAWERRDLDAYVGLYHGSSAPAKRGRRDPARRAPQFSKTRIQARATDLFSQYDRIQINVGRMDVRRAGDAIVSTFDQDFTAWRLGSDAAPAYVDRGRKTLVFAQDERSEWRIVSEEWRQLAQ